MKKRNQLELPEQAAHFTVPLLAVTENVIMTLVYARIHQLLFSFGS